MVASPDLGERGVPPVHRRLASAPVAAPLAEWTQSDDGVALGLPGVGRAIVSRSGIIVEAPDQDGWAAVLARLGAWALGQYLRAHGMRVVPGCCVVTGDVCLVIVGAPRSGTSSLGAALTLAGWRLVADAVVAIGADGVVHAHDLPMRVDAIPGRRIFAGIAHDSAGSGRQRVILDVPRSEQGVKVTHLLTLVANRQLDRAYLQEPGTSAERILNEVDLPGLVPGSRPVAPMAVRPDSRRLVRPSSSEIDVVRDHLPHRLACLLIDDWLEPS